MRGEKLGANLPQFWNNDGKDRPKGQIYPLAKKEVFQTNNIWGKLIISAFQRYKGLGVADKVFI